jgi:hypothetical protein
MVVLTGVGGDWHTLEGTSDQKWLDQLNWEIDGTLGNDENSGFPGQPLATMTEIQRRWGSDPSLGTGVRTISFKSLPSDGEFYLKFRRSDPDARVDVKDESVRTVLASGVLATYTPYSITNNECPIVSVTGVDFTTLVDKRINFGTNGLARVVSANPNGLGTTFARITVPQVQGVDWRIDLLLGLQ